MSLSSRLTQERQRVEALLDRALSQGPDFAESLGNATFNEAVAHALKSGGKRVRPILTLLCADACLVTEAQQRDAEAAAVAIELLHSYTLVHDDLPAMDNDVERRGAPTVWKQYGEGEAILVGDYLQALAFEQLTHCHTLAQLLPAFTRAATCVIRGQVTDIAAAKVDASTWDEALVHMVFLNKTAMLIATACLLGAIAAGATEAQQDAVFTYGTYVGLAFQYIDDLLDAQQSQVGNELSALAVFHQDTAALQERAQSYTEKALQALDQLPGDTTVLQAFAQSLISRLA